MKLPAHESPGERPIGRSNRTAHGLTVEYCEFSCYPAFKWCPKYWNGLYHSNLAAVFMNYGGPRSVVRHNLWKPNIPRLNHAVRVDGSLDEWGQPALTLAGPSDVGDPAPGMKCGRWNGPDDMSVKVYWGHDGDALYVAGKVTDDRQVNKQTGDMIWNGDAMQMLVGPCNMALALTEAGVVFHQFSGPDRTLRDRAEYKVVRDEKSKATVYELRLPLAALGLQPGAEFDFNIVFLDDDDGKGHRYWLQLAPGLCGRPAANPRYILAK